MTLKRLLFLILFSICSIPVSQAEETDQFTLPPHDLLDMGPRASRELFSVLETVVAETNSDIQRLIPKSRHNRYAASQLALRRQDTYLVDRVYDKTGPGFPRWLRSSFLQRDPKPKQYKEMRPWKNVYWLSFSQSPLSLIGLAPTINMYDHYFGTDKLGHFFMQGHTYYKIYSYFLNHSHSAKKAHGAIIMYGQVLEQSYLGTLVNGIYSNADLSANYSGWKFYTNIGHGVKMGNRTLPPILVLNGDKWEFSKHVNRDTLLKPYITDNLSEAFNPCRYAFTRNQIRRQVKKRCADWIQRKGITHQMVDAKLAETRRWKGEEYGHWLPEKNAVTLNTCFGGK